MKKLFSIVLLMVCTIALLAQSNNNQDEVVKIDRWNQNAYREGEVIVKFKADGAVQMRKNVKGKFQTASTSQVDALFAELGIEEVEELMPNVGARKAPRRMRAYNGTEVKDHDLSKLYLVRFNQQVAAPMSNAGEMRTVHQVVEQLQTLDEVEFAEPNYLVFALSTESADSATYVAEPLYSQQWGPAAINLPALWNMPKISDKRPVIAIIDTGVDTEHPDLKDNMWVNEKEKNGVAGKDDDGNGIVDDIHGYDFVNKTGGMADFNGHGTHCAGIAAAVGHNGIGITGANPDALIMPIQVMGKNGSGSVATIIKGIDYANANGADILSMSIGGCGYSSAQEEALLKAFYNGKYLVGAAGNDGADIYDEDLNCGQAHMFPAAFNIVIGVMSTDKSGEKSSFSNYDSDGPYYADWAAEGSTIEEGQTYWNYDIAVPGSNIMSTYLNGTYRELSGTSMATPLVAGALSRLLQCRTYSSQESAMGVIIQNRDTVKSYNNLDVKASMEFDEMNVSPVLVVTNYQIVDTINGGNGDGKPNPGETIEIYPTVRCIYGNAYGASVQMHHGLNVDTTTLEILQNKAELYNLSPGSSVRSKTPIVTKVAERCEDGYTIQLYSSIHFDSVPGTSMAEISAYARKLVLEISRDSYLKGVLDTVLNLGPDLEHYFNGNFAMTNNAVLNILPGAIVHFKKSFTMSSGSQINVHPGATLSIELTSIAASVDFQKGKVKMKGEADNMINLIYSENNEGRFLWPNKDTIEYVSCKDIRQDKNSSSLLLKNCNIEGDVAYAKLMNCNVSACGGLGFDHVVSYYSNIVNNVIINLSDAPWSTSYYNTPHFCNIMNKYAYNNAIKNVVGYFSGAPIGIIKLVDPCWFGTRDETILRRGTYDINNNVGYGEVDMSNFLDRPVKEAHGIVWKIHVDDEEILPYKQTLTPIGVGKHKFEVYYNRAMDTSVNPTISFGVREPYTQHIVAEDPSWSADSTIFTAYYTIGARTMTDGVNHVHITGGRDNEKFPIPDEKDRFDIIVQATGSLSTGLFAEAGLGKVTLQWETDEEDFEDLMGYHIYRWTEDTIKWDRHYDSSCQCYIEAGWKFDTIIINDQLLTPEDTMFVDYDVVPGKSYYYEIQQVTTSFNEYNFSNPVAATPLTAQKGDANGSMNVDVADVVTEIAYLTGNNPQPFIFEAADVNSDNTVNILDIVGTVNIITNPAVSSLGFLDNNTATYSIEDGILYIETPVVLGGVQFVFNADAEISALEALNGFEQMTWNTTDHLNFMAYSMSGKTLGVGKHALLNVKDADIEQIILSNAQGQNVPAIDATATKLSVVEAMQMRLPSPNPFTTQVNIPYVVGQIGNHHVRLVFTNVAGMVVDSYTANQSFGEYTYTWRPAALLEGVYFVTLFVDGKKMQSSKLVKVN